jgi:hypothetical protein
MDKVRALIRAQLEPAPKRVGYRYNHEAAGRFYAALKELYAAAKALQLADDLLYELNQFRKQPEIDALIERYTAANPPAE